MIKTKERPDKTIARSMTFLRALVEEETPREFAVRLWDGSELPAEIEKPRFTLVLKHPGALRRMFRSMDSDLSLGEAYVYDDFDIEGDLNAVFPVAERIMARDWSLGSRLRLGWELLHLPRKRPQPNGQRQAAQVDGDPHSIERDHQAVTYHYDVSNDFYALWLDRRMVYSCAYFRQPGQDLNTAQEQKLDLICRKLNLQPGERLLDIGCGWGGLAIYAAQHYGVQVLGITLSQPQADLANQRIHEAGLTDRCRVEVRDYRQLDDEEGFDKLVSVGMFEHVGENLLPTYFQQAWRLLKPGGLFLNHGIAGVASRPRSKHPTFVNRYVFPDGELVPIHITLNAAENAGFEVRDVESLREHYALTLHHWVRRLEERREDALRIVDEPTYRVWRLFMAGSAYGFEQANLNLYQTLLAKPDGGVSQAPWTREGWYANEG